MTIAILENPTVAAMADALRPLSDEMLSWEFGRRITLEARGHMMAYASDLSLRELTSDEMHEIAGDERILAIQRARQRAEQSGSSS